MDALKNLDRKTSLIITIVLVIIIGCPSLFCCLFGTISAVGGGTYELGAESGQISPVVGIGLVCLSLIGLAIPVATWFLMVRGKTD